MESNVDGRNKLDCYQGRFQVIYLLVRILKARKEAVRVDAPFILVLRVVRSRRGRLLLHLYTVSQIITYLQCADDCMHKHRS